MVLLLPFAEPRSKAQMKDSSPHHNGRWWGKVVYVSSYKNTLVIKSKICPAPAYPTVTPWPYLGECMWQPLSLEDGFKEEAGICYRPFGEDDLGLGVDFRADTSPWLHGSSLLGREFAQRNTRLGRRPGDILG